WCCHRSRNDASHTTSCRSSAFAMNDTFFAIYSFAPSQVMAVGNIDQNTFAQCFAKSSMYVFMTSRCIITSQVHRQPIFHTIVCAQVQPRQMLHLTWQRTLLHSEGRIMFGNIGTQSTRTTV